MGCDVLNLKGAHGDEADFKGEHHAVYNALSARNLSLNLLVEHDTRGSVSSPHSPLPGSHRPATLYIYYHVLTSFT